MEEALPQTPSRRQDGLLLTWVRALPESVVAPKPGAQHRVRLGADDVG